VEAITALAITSMAGAVVLLAIEGTLSRSDDALDEAIAKGIAKQTIDEVLGMRYVAPGSSPYQYPLVANSWEQNGSGRERFNDIDDFNGYTVDGIEDLYGNAFGEGDGEGGFRHPNFRVDSGYFSNWRHEISVYYIDPTDLTLALPAGQTSDFRAVEVVVSKQLADGTWQELARVRRVHAYVPTS